MTNSRNIKTVDLIEALRRCSTPGVHCDGCVFCSDEDHEEPWCGDVLLQEAVRRLEEYTDRCARYAEEIAVLKAAGERVEWIPVTEPPKKWRSENGVTVQEWRPASEPPKEDGRYYVARYDYVTKTPFADILWFEKGQWWNRLHGGNFAVTHWMPLPVPPKGE